MNDELYETGMQIRRAVLGDEYVDRSLAGADELGEPLQRLVTEYCWGAAWGREGLTRRERSMANISMLTALNRPHELRTHMRGALNNGVTREEIVELILQGAVYCGMPAGLDAMRCLREALAEMGDAVPGGDARA